MYMYMYVCVCVTTFSVDYSLTSLLLLLSLTQLSKEIHLIEEATAEANKPPEVSTPLPTEQEEKPSGKGKKGGAKVLIGNGRS